MNEEQTSAPDENTWSRGSLIPLMVVVPMILLALAFWTRSLQNDRLDVPQTAQSGYIEQQLAPDRSRAASDRTLDRMKEDRIDDIASTNTSVPQTETELKDALQNLKVALNALESQAERSEMNTTYARLETELEILEDKSQIQDAPKTQDEIRRLGDELSELRLEVTRLEADLNDVATAR